MRPDVNRNSGHDTQVAVVRTALGTEERLTRTAPLALRFRECAAAQGVTICSEETYQPILGFGGAFTEAGAYTLSRLSPELRDEVLRAYFDPERGSRYSLSRTHINSCDFSLGNYSYDDVEGDHELRHFDVFRDRALLIPYIRDALRIASGEVRIIASPWSPPAWMKTNGDMNAGGRLKPECRPAWALYFVRYIEAYRAEGIPIWGVSVQNEPHARQVWDSCLYSNEEQRDFIRENLGPCLEEAGLSATRILVWDHNKDGILDCARTILSDHAAARYVWGVAFHWYSGDGFADLDRVHRLFPGKPLLFTEGCQEGGVNLGSWELGERYGHAIIGDLNHWTVGWIDWNMVLDERGGPNHAGNFCDAPVIVDTATGTIHRQSAYYYIGHFSRFIRPGALRVGVRVTHPDLEAVACRNPDGTIVVVTMNSTASAASFELRDRNRAADVFLPPRSIATLSYVNGAEEPGPRTVRPE